jgi:cytochrome c553
MKAVLAHSGVKRALLGLLVLFVFAVLVGFVWLPMAKPDYSAAGLWNAICRAAGVPGTWSTELALDDPMASRVKMVPALLGTAGGDVGHGGTLALRCTMCHGARGVSSSEVPNLAGQYAEVVFKQLVDYKNGQRRHVLMEALARELSEQDIRDLSAFYAQLARPSPNPRETPVPRLVSVGDPMRNIAPCATCHGGIDRKPGSPWLEGMSHPYLTLQLQHFASGERRNDNLQAMRNVARQMTPEEIEQAARYYSTLAIVGLHQ